jgi:beta-lactamase superfamily II metal-dependent hydrolase
VNFRLCGVALLGHRPRSARHGNVVRATGCFWSHVSVIAPPTEAEGGLFSEINDNSVAILLTYGTARILLAGDAEANEEEYMANGP